MSARERNTMEKIPDHVHHCCEPEIKRLKEALEFYADPIRYHICFQPLSDECRENICIGFDQGRKAREVLKEDSQ